jgi:hypothetical protein
LAENENRAAELVMGVGCGLWIMDLMLTLTVWIVAAEAEKAREAKAREEKKQIAADLEKQRLEILEEQKRAN